MLHGGHDIGHAPSDGLELALGFGARFKRRASVFFRRAHRNAKNVFGRPHMAINVGLY